MNTPIVELDDTGRGLAFGCLFGLALDILIVGCVFVLWRVV